MVYGEPAIAVPLSSLRTRIKIEESTNDHTVIIAEDINQSIFISKDAYENNPLAYAARLTLDKLKIEDPKVKIYISSDIPFASGFGSGASVSTALVKALCHISQKPLSLEEINAIVFQVEKIHHGNPSGVDNTVIVYEQAIYYKKESPLEKLNIGKKLCLLIADTGIPAPTHITVNDIKQLSLSNPQETFAKIHKIGEIVNTARHSIETGDLEDIGELMLQNQALLKELSVSSDIIEHLIKVAMDEGALGAKLSGGGRGGNVICLIQPDDKDKISSTLLQAGAKRVYYTEVD
ncbi:mevalonate kinase [Anaerolineales bacterium]